MNVNTARICEYCCGIKRFEACIPTQNYMHCPYVLGNKKLNILCLHGAKLKVEAMCADDFAHDEMDFWELKEMLQKLHINIADGAANCMHAKQS